MASKIKVDTLETADGTGSITLSNQFSGMTVASLPSSVVTEDASGNVGIGVTPESDWENTYKVLQIGQGGSIAGGATDSDNIIIGANWYSNAGVDSYITSNKWSSTHQLNNGKHFFRVAPSGTADSAISWNTAMTIDNSGRVTMPYQPIFRVYRSGSNWSQSDNVWENLSANTIGFDTASSYSTTNHRYTAPVAGYYYLNFKINVYGATGSRLYTSLRVNGTSIVFHADYISTGSDEGGEVSVMWYLNAGDYVEPWSKTQGAGASHSNGYNWNWFEGRLLG